MVRDIKMADLFTNFSNSSNAGLFFRLHPPTRNDPLLRVSAAAHQQHLGWKAKMNRYQGQDRAGSNYHHSPQTNTRFSSMWPDSQSPARKFRHTHDEINFKIIYSTVLSVK